jgi:hypothetical protein
MTEWMVQIRKDTATSTMDMDNCQESWSMLAIMGIVVAMWSRSV